MEFKPLLSSFVTTWLFSNFDHFQLRLGVGFSEKHGIQAVVIKLRYYLARLFCETTLAILNSLKVPLEQTTLQSFADFGRQKKLKFNERL